MTTYKCSFNGEQKIIDALNLQDARVKFEEKYGFWPSEDLVDIRLSTVRLVS